MKNEWSGRTIALKQMKDWQGLLDWCQKWTKSEPLNVNAWLGLGVAYNNLNRFDEAIEAFRESLHINSDYAEAWFKLGVACWMLNRLDEAIEAFSEVVRINPEHANAWFCIGATYGVLNRSDEAIEAFREVVRINPEDANTWLCLVISYQSLDRHDEAREAINQVMRINPDDYANNSYNLGTSAAIADDRMVALVAFKTLMDLDPKLAHKFIQTKRAMLMELKKTEETKDIMPVK